MSRRTVTRTVTQTTEHRAEITPEELRKRFRLPPDAIVMATDSTGLSVSCDKLSATWTTTNTKGAK